MFLTFVNTNGMLLFTSYIHWEIMWELWRPMLCKDVQNLSKQNKMKESLWKTSKKTTDFIENKTYCFCVSLIKQWITRISCCQIKCKTFITKQEHLLGLKNLGACLKNLHKMLLISQAHQVCRWNNEKKVGDAVREGKWCRHGEVAEVGARGGKEEVWKWGGGRRTNSRYGCKR